MVKKVFVRPRLKRGPWPSQEDKDKRLVHEASRVLLQTARKVKAFELQRLTRLTARASQGEPRSEEDAAASAKRQRKTANHAARAELVKRLDLSSTVVAHALAKLGLSEHDAATDATAAAAAASPADFATAELVQRMVGHNKMKAAIELLDGKVRQRRIERLAVAEGRPVPRARPAAAATVDEGGAKAEKKKKPRPVVPPVVNHHSAHAVFLTSLSGDVESEEEGEADEEAGPVRRKNRPGQRARQARHALKEERKAAKLEGRPPGGPKWQEQQQQLRGGSRGQEQQQKQPANRKRARDEPPSASARKRRTADGRNANGRGAPVPAPSAAAAAAAEGGESMHPSWAAKQQQRAKLAQIAAAKPAGRKTTFADSDED